MPRSVGVSTSQNFDEEKQNHMNNDTKYADLGQFFAQSHSERKIEKHNQSRI